MESNNKTQVNKDLQAKTIHVSRTFNAPLKTVWRAYTEPELLDQWWGPKPWRAETKSMDFSVGGYWLYAMVGPNEERHWARADYTAINAPENFAAKDGFCDEHGVLNEEMPRSAWENVFTETPEGTLVSIKIVFEKEEYMQATLDMGFEQGFLMGISQLEELLKTL
ncbi:ATPase [Taibaiella sp. KBW10]|uniref:SRPBCC family protein n=1 Tax=Taibaiella sp. KBW10 TaxID=2153357 RepID=UPI000F59567C|nr:SRPBCC domain-containing protein [Taibaiella sp. KBW10]RQO29774.1 ATPase [Taibaiella sp. KBW10]